MQKKEVLISKYICIIILFLTACTVSEGEQRDLIIKIDAEAIEKRAIKSDSDYLVPLQLILDTYQIDYQKEDDVFLFLDMEIDVNKQVIVKGCDDAELLVKKIDDETYISLDFMTEHLRLSYVKNDNEINLITGAQLLFPYEKALSIFGENEKALITDVETGLQFNVKRIPAGEGTAAVVEPITEEDTAILFKANGNQWNHYRRSVLVEVDGIIMAGSLTPFPCSGRQDKPTGEIVDNRSGSSGRGINYNYNYENNMEGVIDIHFLNSINVGKQRIDQIHQQKVFEAAQYGRSIIE